MKINLYSIIICVLIISANEINYSQIIDSSEKWVKVAEGLNFPEGPAYDGKSAIYLSNCYGGWITKYSDGKVDTFIHKNDQMLSIEKTNGLTFGLSLIHI